MTDSKIFWFVMGMLAMALLSVIGTFVLTRFCGKDESESKPPIDPIRMVEEEEKRNEGEKL